VAKGDSQVSEPTSGQQPNDSEPIIKVRGLHKYFGPLHVIRGVDLEVKPKEVVVIIGPSGGGKSTFLRCLNFLEAPSAGIIEIDGVEIKAREKASEHHRHIREIRRKAGMVFQQFNLFPHMTALGNIIEAPGQAGRVPFAPFGGAAATGGHCPRSVHGAQDHAL